MLNTNDSAVILAGLAKREILYLAVTAWNAKGESPYSEEQAVVSDDDPARAVVCTWPKDRMRSKEASTSQRTCISLLSYGWILKTREAYRTRGMLYERLSKTDLAHEDYQRAEKIFKKKLLSKKRASG